jgi:hypothetical protein
MLCQEFARKHPELSLRGGWADDAISRRARGVACDGIASILSQ